MKEMLQIISVRHKSYKEHLATQQDFHFGKGSSGKIIQCSHTFSPDRFRTTEKVTISLERDAVAEFYIMQNEHNNAEHSTSYEVNLVPEPFLKWFSSRSTVELYATTSFSISMKSLRNATWQDSILQTPSS